MYNAGPILPVAENPYIDQVRARDRSRPLCPHKRMSANFQSCPQCESMVLSDTIECPECGHVFDEDRASAGRAENDGVKSHHELYDTCTECGESVRSGLVRCWSCNSFMRKDVEAKYRELTSQPQQIIFSEIPKEQRTEFMAARGDQAHRRAPRAPIFDAEEEDDEFTLSGSPGTTTTVQAAPPVAAPATPQPPADDADDGFELDSTTRPAAQQTPAAEMEKIDAAAPKEDAKTADAESADTAKAPAGDQEADDKKADGDKSDDASKAQPDSEIGADDLLNIALQDQKETKRRKREKIQEARQRRVLLPCTACGAWIRVHQDQAGKTVRCRQCKAPIVVPFIKKKEKSAEKSRPAAAKIDVTWIDDVHQHVVKPTDVTLKPGSLQKTFEVVDVAFHESGMHILKYAPPAKKGLFGKSSDGPPPVEEQRKLVREHIQKTGKIANLPFGELQTVTPEQAEKVRLVQPVAEASASMFAGVPVFGEGQIAVYLPIDLPDNQQAFLSSPLTVSRKLSSELKSHFNVDIGASENGVPADEEFETLKCHLSELPVKSLKNVVYYQNDPAFEVELAGHICATCGIAITEEARAKKKLGGAAGKGIAKAKCPKCSNKFGDQKAWNLSKTPESEAPEEEEDVSEVLKPKPKEAAAPEQKPEAGTDTK